MPIPAKAASRKQAMTVISLVPEQTIRDIDTLHTKLLAGLDAKATVRLVAAPLMQVDTPTVQLLCAFMLESRQRGVEVEWDSPSEALSLTARLLGVSEVLALEQPSGTASGWHHEP